MGHINSTTINTDWERGKHLNFEDRCSIKVFASWNILCAESPMNWTVHHQLLCMSLEEAQANVMELVGASLNTLPYVVRADTKPIAYVAISILVLQRITLLLCGLSVWFEVNTGLLMHVWAMRRHMIVSWRRHYLYKDFLQPCLERNHITYAIWHSWSIKAQIQES